MRGNYVQTSTTLNVSNLQEAIQFYSRMFEVSPIKIKPGYANYVIDDPPLKLVLFESTEAGTINHLGVEVETVEDVLSAEKRLANAELDTTGIEETICCFAEKTETWVTDPDDLRWEWYVKKNDNEKQFDNVVLNKSDGDKDDQIATSGRHL